MELDLPIKAALSFYIVCNTSLFIWLIVRYLINPDQERGCIRIVYNTTINSLNAPTIVIIAINGVAVFLKIVFLVMRIL